MRHPVTNESRKDSFPLQKNKIAAKLNIGSQLIKKRAFEHFYRQRRKRPASPFATNYYATLFQMNAALASLLYTNRGVGFTISSHFINSTLLVNKTSGEIYFFEMSLRAN